ncbi:carboxypeptidase-like regulatory domain-containing protein, partial [Gemmatimonas sp.]
MRHFRQLAIALWALAGAAVVPVSNASAQGPTTGAISGIVTDSSGNGLEGATITAVNQATGFRQSTQSRRGGAYTLQALETGTYNVSARL